MKPHQILRASMLPAHEAVDGAFSCFDLVDRNAYAAFLNAHARALPAIEKALAADPTLPAWRARTPLLAADLAALGASLPAPLALDPPPGPPERWGMLYVIEGSRLGGGMLAQRVGEGLPRSYLSATHLPAEWRHFLTAFDHAAEQEGEAWLEKARSGAARAFALYETAASLETA